MYQNKFKYILCYFLYWFCCILSILPVAPFTSTKYESVLNRSCVVPTVRHNDTGANRSSADPCAAARFAAPRGRACARARRREEGVMPRTARSLPAPCARPPSTRRAGHAHGVTGASWTTKHSQTWSPTHGSPTHKRDFLKLYLMKSEICAFKSLLGFLLRRVHSRIRNNKKS